MRTQPVSIFIVKIYNQNIDTTDLNTEQLINDMHDLQKLTRQYVKVLNIASIDDIWERVFWGILDHMHQYVNQSMLETWRKKTDSGAMTIQMPSSFWDSSVSFEEEKERGGEEFNIQDPGCLKF